MANLYLGLNRVILAQCRQFSVTIRVPPFVRRLAERLRLLWLMVNYVNTVCLRAEPHSTLLRGKEGHSNAPQAPVQIFQVKKCGSAPRDGVPLPGVKFDL